MREWNVPVPVDCTALEPPDVTNGASVVTLPTPYFAAVTP